MEKFRERVQKHKTLAWVIMLAYIIFQGCFAFPFSNELFPFDYDKAIIILIGYGIIGMCFAGLLPKRKSILVSLVSLGFTIIGLGCRYALEFGEVSNTRNFIPQNIISYLIITPIYCMAVYWCIYFFESKAN